MPTPLAHEKVMGARSILLSLNSKIQDQQQLDNLISYVGR